LNIDKKHLLSLFKQNIKVKKSENSFMISNLKKQAHDSQYATSLMMMIAFILIVYINIFVANVMKFMLLSIAKH